jgi:LmbE family N-acetylglucosaminyl deacetylase
LIERLVSRVSPETHILAPWTGDVHPDHEACGRAAAEVARRSGATLSYWIFWAWHRGDPDRIGKLHMRSFALTEDLLRAKTDALLCHRSQLAHESGEPILPEDLLAPARRPFEVFVTL